MKDLKISKRLGSSISVEKRNAVEGKTGYVVSGYAALFDTPSDKGGWYTERIAPGAFNESLQEVDVRALLNHDSNHVLARYKSDRPDELNTMKVVEDDKGLYFEFELPESRQDLIEAALRGDITQTSFAFRVDKETWSEESRTVDGKEVEWPTRSIDKIKDLLDVSIVTYPFYEEASFGIERNSYDAYKENLEKDTPEDVLKKKAQEAKNQIRNNKIKEAAMRLRS